MSRSRIRPITWTCILTLVLLGSSSALPDDSYGYALTEASVAAVTSSERTSNAIPEAEEAPAHAKKYDKPYPYEKADAVRKALDNSIQQSKRSGGVDAARINGTLTISFDDPEPEPQPKPESEPEATSEPETTTTEATTTEEDEEEEEEASTETEVTTPTTTEAVTETEAETTTSAAETTATTSGKTTVTVPSETTTTTSDKPTVTVPSETTATTSGKPTETVPSETTTDSADSTTPTCETDTDAPGDEIYMDWSTTSGTSGTKAVETTSTRVSRTTQTVATTPQARSTATDEATTNEPEATTTEASVITTSTTSATTATLATTTCATEETSTAETEALTTITELPTTTVKEEPPTTATDEDQIKTTLAVTAAPTTTVSSTTAATMVTAAVTTATTITVARTARTTAESTTAATELLTETVKTTETTSMIPTVATIPPETTTATPRSTTTPTTPSTISVTTTSRSTADLDAYLSVGPTQDDIPESTTETIASTPATEDVTLLIRIVFEGSWRDICAKLPILRQSLAELVNVSAEKPISAGQVIFHQTQCSGNLAPTSLMSEIPLTPVLVYIVDENGNFDGALTKSLPSLYETSTIDFPVKIYSVGLVQEADSGNAIAVVIVSCVAFICLILLAALLFIMRKRQGRFNYGERCRPVSLDAYSLDSVSAYNSVRRSKGALRSSKRSYGNPTFEDSSAIPSHPMNFAGLANFCKDVGAISEEFGSIPQVSSNMDELPPGAELKNRYANVIPLPETRVVLQRINNDPLSEYINANYVRGPKNANKYYIACQAPTESTVCDFWRMIWEQQCKVIIMLTDLIENGVEKCTEYIPPLEVSDCHRLYGDYQVTLKKREAKEKYAISTLHLKNLENNTFREVWHIWYLWPANGCPTDAAALIAVLLEARALQRGAAGPIVVHCSPGTGRTGTLIALDLGIRQYEITRTVDVPRVVYTIRRDRAGAVQTREQYSFIYKGLNLYAGKLAGGAIESS